MKLTESLLADDADRAFLLESAFAEVVQLFVYFPVLHMLPYAASECLPRRRPSKGERRRSRYLTTHVVDFPSEIDLYRTRIDAVLRSPVQQTSAGGGSAIGPVAESIVRGTLLKCLVRSIFT